MFARSKFKIPMVASSAVLALLLTLSGCSATESDVGILDDDNEPITFLVEDDDMYGNTRGRYESAKQFSTYAIYSYYTSNNILYMANAVMTKQDDGSWLSSRTVSFPGKKALNFYAMKPGFQRSDVQELNMSTALERSFVHTLPNINAQQTDFMFASLMDKTKETTGGVVKFKFKHLFAYLRFQGQLTKEGINVKVHSITLHNLKSTGKFSFSLTDVNGGSWDLSDAKDNYTYVLPADYDLTEQMLLMHPRDSMLFVMAQNPEVFDLNDGTFANADVDGNKKAYLEVKCRVWKMDDDGSGGQVARYIGCSETTWATVYYPLDTKTTQWKSSLYPFAGTFNVNINFSGGYTYEGEDFLSKYTNDELQMSSLEPVTSELVTVPWADDTTNSVEFDL